MSNLDKWNKNRTKEIKNKVKYQREGKAVLIKYSVIIWKYRKPSRTKYPRIIFVNRP